MGKLKKKALLITTCIASPTPSGLPRPSYGISGISGISPPVDPRSMPGPKEFMYAGTWAFDKYAFAKQCHHLEVHSTAGS